MSNDTKHTQEPLRIRAPKTGYEANSGEVITDATGDPICKIETRRFASDLTSEAIPDDVRKWRAARIVACVNAMAGIADPAAAIAQAREALEKALRFAKNYGGSDSFIDCLTKAIALLKPEKPV